MLYPDLGSTSNQLNVRGRKVLPNGGSRSSIQSAPYTIFLDACRGNTLSMSTATNTLISTITTRLSFTVIATQKSSKQLPGKLQRGRPSPLVARLRLNLQNYFVSVCPSLSRYVL